MIAVRGAETLAGTSTCSVAAKRSGAADRQHQSVCAQLTGGCHDLFKQVFPAADFGALPFFNGFVGGNFRSFRT